MSGHPFIAGVFAAVAHIELVAPHHTVSWEGWAHGSQLAS